MKYYLKVLKNYATFSGRARRSEYWYFQLFNALIFSAINLSAIISFVYGFVGAGAGITIFYYIYLLATLVPSIAVSVRRMHDVGKSGWFIFIPIYSLILACEDGFKGDNEYGADPKANSESKTSGGFSSLMSALVIVISLIVGVIIYKFVFGYPGNFVDGDINGEPVTEGWGATLAIIYKGGVIVPILVAINIIIIIFSLERLVTLARARGVRDALIQFILFIFVSPLAWLTYFLFTKNKNVKPTVFLSEFRKLLKNGQIDSAIELCDKTQSSLANVVRAGLQKYKNLVNDNSMDKEQKIESLKKELEEATSLELPMLSKNLVVISTCASVATLIGLIGTVMGMIRSFAAMSQGAPDTAELATGISEALINTFFGIAGSTIAIIMYNFFSTKIDSMTYSIDEASFTIIQDFSASK